jgi:hypothetical protein
VQECPSDVQVSVTSGLEQQGCSQVDDNPERSHPDHCPPCHRTFVAETTNRFPTDPTNRDQEKNGIRQRRQD